MRCPMAAAVVLGWVCAAAWPPPSSQEDEHEPAAAPPEAPSPREVHFTELAATFVRPDCAAFMMMAATSSGCDTMAT